MKLGIDAVDIDRFEKWHTFAHKKLARIFSEEEIDYCLAIQAKSAERFAARFAVREAFYKALMTLNNTNLPLLTVIRNVSVARHTSGLPELVVNWQELGFEKPLPTALSLTHTRTTAVAVVLINHEGKS